ncbi:SRPBCC family protein [Chitinophaga agrisoli]|uniref:SRPBCC family protein n=1 Tax=Chitinophaga agrisoli TaxID=2607653 RepID=A0A5B2W0D9_9BACT|nr:SRPBCC family protein [Chitinophaga agrisoli]KAA2244408.1 SRPBCC family protein [Chitinophaga agrisoli]
MSILSGIVIVLAALIALLLIVALFVKKGYTIEREITINQSKQTVFNYVKLIRNQDNFNKWNMEDPNSKKTFRGTDGAAGFVYAWDSENKKVGKGEQEIKNVREGEGIDTELRFIRPFEGKADAHITTAAVSGDQTKVKWSFSSSTKYPMNIMLVLLNLEGMLAKDLESSLANLKTVLENL